MFCPACGSKNDDNAKFCKKCGQDFSIIPTINPKTEVKCPYCAEEINPHAVKCKHCGEWLDKNSQPKRVGKDYTVAIILGVIFTVFGGIIGFIISLYLATREDEKTRNIGVLLLIINIIWIFLLLIIITSWINTFNHYYYY